MKLLVYLGVLIVGASAGALPHAAPGAICEFMYTDIEYLFYSLKNPAEPISIASNRPQDVNITHFDSSKKTILLLHGTGTNSSGDFVQKIRQAVVDGKLDVNLIAVDWFRFQDRNKKLDVSGCGSMVGYIIGDFLQTLSKNFGLKYSNLTLVGFSLGGGIVGTIGSNLGSEVANIVALEGCTNRNSGKLVECIHTSGPNYSFMAHANYFPNGGGPQPHCATNDSWCDHFLATDYYAESLTSQKFVGRDCDSWENFKAGKCENGTVGVMGGIDLDKIKGKFYMYTNANPPYGRG